MNSYTSGPYIPETVDRIELEGRSGPLVIEFGTNWCGYCRAAQPVINAALAGHATVPHIKVEDGSGRPLGRAFGVKLWPTLIFMRDGQEIDRLVRPQNPEAVQAVLARIA